MQIRNHQPVSALGREPARRARTGSWYASAGVYYRTPNHLNPVLREIALDIVTRNYGFAYSRERGIIRVMPKARLQTEEPITEVIPLNYIIQGAEGEDHRTCPRVSGRALRRGRGGVVTAGISLHLKVTDRRTEGRYSCLIVDRVVSVMVV